MAGFSPAALRVLSAAVRARPSAPLGSSSLAGLRLMSTSSLRPTLSTTAFALRAPPPAGSFFAQSYLPFSASRSSFFTPSRYASTVSPIPVAEPAEDVRTIPRSLPVWLLGCSALVFGIIVIGGLTRLTESGLSIVEWNPITGIRPPITDAEWDVEWEKYRISPEGVLMNANITRGEFKKIFYMEWAHRIAGRALGLVFVVPAIYYCSRYKLPRGLPTKLLALGAGIGVQGLIGWLMVASGLNEEIIANNEVPRVSQYRLAAHFSAALVLYMGMFYTALGLRHDQKLAASLKTPGGAAAVDALNKAMTSPAVRGFRGLTALLGAMVLLTAVSGAFVAGLDAGLVYNEFPFMGEGLAPPKDELLDPKYSNDPEQKDLVWRNMLENPVTAQFDHRVLAVTTFTGLILQHLIARRPILRLSPTALTRASQRWSAWTAAAALGQVTLGITTLLYLVPVPLAAMHQAGSVVVLTCIMGLAASMRRPGKAVRAMREALRRSEIKVAPGTVVPPRV